MIIFGFIKLTKLGDFKFQLTLQQAEYKNVIQNGHYSLFSVSIFPPRKVAPITIAALIRTMFFIIY